MSRLRLLELLGLNAGASRDEIKSRYHELARRFHPDANISDERSHARFRAIVAAYQELLMDKADVGSPHEWAAYAPPAVKARGSDNVDVESRTPTTSRNSDGG